VKTDVLAGELCSASSSTTLLLKRKNRHHLKSESSINQSSLAKIFLTIIRQHHHHHHQAALTDHHQSTKQNHAAALGSARSVCFLSWWLEKLPAEILQNIKLCIREAQAAARPPARAQALEYLFSRAVFLLLNKF
jgi:hypothetical protein